MTNAVNLASLAVSGALSADSSGNVSIASGNLVIGTAGKGIDFSATSGTGTSELLADYEEGTFSPNIFPATGAFSAVSYNVAHSGYYTKIGRLVNVLGLVYVNSYTVGTGIGNMRISLPFTAANVTQNFSPGIIMQYGGGGYTPSITTAKVSARAEVNNAFFTLGVDNNTNYADELVGTFSTSGILFRFNLTYFAA
jgi:hypothetical protein